MLVIGPKDKIKAIIYPFDVRVWIGLGISVLVMVICLHLVTMFNGRYLYLKRIMTNDLCKS